MHNTMQHATGFDLVALQMPQGWELIIILALVFLLFGAKKMPDAARGIGRSLRILKTETKGLHDEDDDDDDASSTSIADESPAQISASAAHTDPSEADSSSQHSAAAPSDDKEPARSKTVGKE